jgi:hypothetical protein
MNRRHLFVSILLVLCFVIPASRALAHTEGDAADGAYVGPNVQVTITIGDVEEQAGPTVRTYRLIARDGGSATRMMMGWRTPIPTSSAADAGGAPASVTSYVYQNVGMTAQVEVRVIGNGRILVTGAIEISGARRNPDVVQAPPGMPLIGTFQQDLNVLLRAGKPLRIAEVPDPEGGTMYLELSAEVLD